MNPQELRNIQNAYLKVVQGQQLNEDSRRISNKQRTQDVKSRIKTFGSNYTPPKTWVDGAGKDGEGEVLTRKQIKKMERRKLAQSELAKRQAPVEVPEEVSVYDIILSHLLDEGYAETPGAARSIMVNMSQEWRDSIIG